MDSKKPLHLSRCGGFLLSGYRYQSTLYVLDVQNPDGVESGVSWIEVDGKRLRTKVLSLVDDGTEHRVLVRMGRVESKSGTEDNGAKVEVAKVEIVNEMLKTD